MNRELPDVQAGFRKGRGTRDQIANIHWIMKKASVPEELLFLLYWLCQSLWLCGSWQTVENSERDGIPENKRYHGNISCKDGHNDRNGMDQTEAEDIKRRWPEYTEELYKKDLHDPDNHDGVITHLEPDILEWYQRYLTCLLRNLYVGQEATVRTGHGTTD